MRTHVNSAFCSISANFPWLKFTFNIKYRLKVCSMHGFGLATYMHCIIYFIVVLKCFIGYFLDFLLLLLFFSSNALSNWMKIASEEIVANFLFRLLQHTNKHTHASKQANKTSNSNSIKPCNFYVLHTIKYKMYHTCTNRSKVLIHH